jgi:hypothetical protein
VLQQSAAAATPGTPRSSPRFDQRLARSPASGRQARTAGRDASRRPLRGSDSERGRGEKRSRRLAPTALTHVDRFRQKIAIAEPLDRPRSGGAVIDDPRLRSFATRHPFHNLALSCCFNARLARPSKGLPLRALATVSWIVRTTWLASNPTRVNAAPLRCDTSKARPTDLLASISKVSGRRGPAGVG